MSFIQSNYTETTLLGTTQALVLPRSEEIEKTTLSLEALLNSSKTTDDPVITNQSDIKDLVPNPQEDELFDASASNNPPGIEQKKTDGLPSDSRNILVFSPLPANNYTEQSPSLPSEWDGIYEKYTLVSQEADIHYDHVSQDGTSDSSKMIMKYKLKDRYFATYYETATAFDISATPCVFWFELPKATNISFMRFYFYHPEGMDYAPAVYEVYNGSVYVATYNITPMVNGQWVRINFDHDIVRTMNFTLKILQTRGSIDHPGVNTKVVINELELFENTIPRKYPQNTIPLYKGVAKFWNDLDWALSLRVDDCSSLSSFPGWWADILPITAICWSSSTIDVTLVNTKHMEVGSHGSMSDHKANYDKTYDWWRTRADTAKASIETYASKTSLWSTKCISFGIPYSVLDPPGGRALYDAGFKNVGWLPIAPGWNMRILGEQNLSLYSVSEPKSQVPMDWMFVQGAGSAKSAWDHDAILRYKESRSYAHLMIHPADNLDPNFKSFIEDDTTAWHSTMGEIASYWWYTQRMNVTYNASSSDTKKIFDINVFEKDPNIWEIPVTFTFDLTDFNLTGNIVVKWRNNNTVYTSDLPNISGFSPGIGQHTNQTMREGYRWDFGNHMLYVSVKPGDMEKPKSLYLSVKPYVTPNIYTGWNLITILIKNNNWDWASTLSENITGCTMISRFDSKNQTFKTYIVGGPPSFDFPIVDGYGYFIHVNKSSALSLSGYPINNVSVPLSVGWNTIGWYHSYDTLASSLGGNIAGCQMISWFDAMKQSFKTYIIGGPPSFDFHITPGMGLFVLVNESSVWYGEG